MKTVNNWLISWTGCLLRHPRLFIMVPILSVFLLSYPAVYIFTLEPLNGVLLTLFDDCVLSDGGHVSYQEQIDISSLRDVENSELYKISYTGANALKYESLHELYTWVKEIDKMDEVTVVLSPASLVPETVFSKTLSGEDKKKMEKCYLKILNHDLPSNLFSLLFDRVGKQNHVTNKAQIVNVLVLTGKNVSLPHAALNSLKQTSQIQIGSSGYAATMGSESVQGESVQSDSIQLNSIQTHYIQTDSIHTDSLIKTIFQTQKSRKIHWLNGFLLVLQATLIIAYAIRFYLSICNSHKIRSNVGLAIGWFSGVVVSILAAISLFPDSLECIDACGSGQFIVIGFHFLGIMIMSSRTLFRTINDLAGDSTFAESESLHKRLIKFYLGFNNSIENSSGVFHISSFIRRIFRLDSFCNQVPIPSTTIIFIINLVGVSGEMLIFALIPRIFMSAHAHSRFMWALFQWHKVVVVTQIIDHLLQLTYSIAIVITDLHSVDLTDVLANASVDDLETDLDNMAFAELNPFSAKLLAGGDETKNTFRHRLGTYFLKLSPFTTKTLWSVIIPLFCISIDGSLALQLYVIEKDTLLMKNLGYNKTTIISHELDPLYFIELATVLILILIIAELVFTYTYSERQKQDLDDGEMSDATKLYLSDLSNVESTSQFEVITFDDESDTEKMRLFANPKASIVVSTDLDHRIIIWSPLKQSNEEKVVDISTTFESSKLFSPNSEFWPVNHVEISNDGDFIMLVNNRNSRIKCYSRRSETFEWEISLTSELTRPKDKMKPVLTFFRKKTVAGFFARELLLRRNRVFGKGDHSSTSSLNTMHGNFSPPVLGHSYSESCSNDNDRKSKQYTQFNREEFVMILETGQMITVSCDSVKTNVYNLLSEVFADDPSLPELKVHSSKFLTTSRMNDRVVCNISNGSIVVGSAINNRWRFSRLEINQVFVSNSLTAFASPSMTRDTWVPQVDRYVDQPEKRQNLNPANLNHDQPLQPQHNSTMDKSMAMNKSTIVTIDFVGMFVRVSNLQAELIDIQTGTVLKLFHIGSFKAGSFRVSHSEPTHCKFCGCVSIETMSLIYEDLYNKTVIVHTYRLINKKSRNNICLRVERDPLEIRCLGFNSVVESQYWFDNIEMWELTDMNVIIGIKKEPPPEKSNNQSLVSKLDGPSQHSEDVGLSTLRNRKHLSDKTTQKTKSPSPQDKWQGFVITASDGKLLNYNIPGMNIRDNLFSMRPSIIIKFGFKAVAIAFGHIVKIIYLGTDKLVEDDLYYSGSASTLDPVLRPSSVGSNSSNELLFINKRRKMMEKKLFRSNGK